MIAQWIPDSSFLSPSSDVSLLQVSGLRLPLPLQLHPPALVPSGPAHLVPLGNPTPPPLLSPRSTILCRFRCRSCIVHAREDFIKANEIDENAADSLRGVDESVHAPSCYRPRSQQGSSMFQHANTYFPPKLISCSSGCLQHVRTDHVQRLLRSLLVTISVGRAVRFIFPLL